MTYSDFEARWKPAGGAERANYGLFLQDLCDLIGVPRPDPTTDNPAQDAYVLERAVEFSDGTGAKRSTGRATIGRIDLYKRGCFVLETKQGTESLSAADERQKRDRVDLGGSAEKRRKGHALRGTPKWEQMMQAARQQALGYVRALPASEPRPLFVLVADVGYCIDVYSNFAGVGDSFVPFPDQNHYRIPLARLADEETRAMLRLIWTDPRELDPSRRAARVTRELAGYLASLSAQLERAGHPADTVAQFLMRCLFTMFSEDVGLIPKESFTGMLRKYADLEMRPYLPDALQLLWQTMDTGGFSPDLKARLRKFNGKLFHDATALPLTADQIALLQRAAEADWTAVEPAIFGTLLERALDPRERHSLGAHYTPRRYVERLVLPTVLEPLRREWTTAQAAAARLLEEARPKEARAELVRFLNRLTSLRILDPACGSGNFLYVTLEHLKRLEGEVLAAINAYGQTALLELGGGTTVSPRQLLGLELNPRAAAIADVVLKIGYLQWHLRTHGIGELREPLLDEYENIRQQDAVLQHGPPTPRLDANNQPVTRWDGITTKTHPVTGQQVPDETARTAVLDFPNPKPAEWPEADFIIGNPPFLGMKRMRLALGDGYAEALRKAYKNKVADSADLVMYWWYNAAKLLQLNKIERLGFITTNSITMIFNRRVIEDFLSDENKPIAITFAIPDHPWVDSAEGAAVRIAMTVAENSMYKQSVVRQSAVTGVLLTVKTEKASIGEDDVEVTFLEQIGAINADLSLGADVTSSVPLRSNSDLCYLGVKFYGQGFVLTDEEFMKLNLTNSRVLVKKFIGGQDLSRAPRGLHVIDATGYTTNDLIEHYPDAYNRLLLYVKPDRDHNPRESKRQRWWLFGENQPAMRESVRRLDRYIVTAETTKHRFFIFIPGDYVAEGTAVVIASDDAYNLGVLSGKIHLVWTLAAGGDLGGNTPRYNKTRCFDPFPFPDASPAQQERIRELAEQLDAHRKRQQAAHATLTLTDLYNVVEKLRAGEPLTTKDQTINQQGLASVVLSLHQQLDAAVADAYGWPDGLPESEILTRLVRLNHERAAEEQAGHIRYLRPEYQQPGQQQMGLNLPTAVLPETPVVPSDAQRDWPKDLAKQMQAVRDVVQQSDGPVSVAQVATRFGKLRPATVQPLLDTLTALALLRQTDEGGYVG